MTAPVRPQDLAALPLFEHFTPDQLAWTVDHVDVTAYDAPTVLFREGDPTDALYVLLDGEIGLYRSVDGDPRRTGGSDVPGAWIGLPTIAPTQRLEARLERPSRLLVIPAATVEEMIAKGMPITPHLLKGLVKGLPQFEDVARQQERMAVLGKLAAGLAHELNNPAAAARRAAGQLRTALAGLAGAGVAIAGGDAALRESWGWWPAAWPTRWPAGGARRGAGRGRGGGGWGGGRGRARGWGGATGPCGSGSRR